MNRGTDCDGICLSVGATQLMVVELQPDGSDLASPTEPTLTYDVALWGLKSYFFLGRSQVRFQNTTGFPCFTGMFLEEVKNIKFYVLLTVHPCIICFKWSQLGVHYFLVYLFQILYMFRATMCPSSEELTVSMRHWYFFTLYGWLSGLQTSHPYSKFSWRWAYSCPKHEEKLK